MIKIHIKLGTFLFIRHSRLSYQKIIKRSCYSNTKVFFPFGSNFTLKLRVTFNDLLYAHAFKRRHITTNSQTIIKNQAMDVRLLAYTLIAFSYTTLLQRHLNVCWRLLNIETTSCINTKLNKTIIQANLSTIVKNSSIQIVIQKILTTILDYHNHFESWWWISITS